MKVFEYLKENEIKIGLISNCITEVLKAENYKIGDVKKLPGSFLHPHFLCYYLNLKYHSGYFNCLHIYFCSLNQKIFIFLIYMIEF